jgi:hypothetical protein
MANARTAVKTRRISPGVYGTLDGSYRTQRNDKGRWLLYDSDGKRVGEEDGYRTSDEALTALTDVLEADLLTLNTPPAKPKVATGPVVDGKATGKTANKPGAEQIADRNQRRKDEAAKRNAHQAKVLKESRNQPATA